MTRILYWNINNFSLGKIWDVLPLWAQDADERREHILAVIEQNPPDIFVIVEVYQRNQDAVALGGCPLPNDNAATACQYLLNLLREKTPTWCLVPILSSGQGGCREGVAVYYDAAKLQFIGPNTLFKLGPTNPVVQSQPIRKATVFPPTPPYPPNYTIPDYPQLWKHCLPNPKNPVRDLKMERKIKLEVDGKEVEFSEHQMSAEWIYYLDEKTRPIPTDASEDGVKRISFPNTDSRSPYLTRFKDIKANPKRTLNIFAVHTSPKNANQALLKIAQIEALKSVKDDEVNVLIGDFNIDSFNPKANAYNWLVAGDGYPKYIMAFDPRCADNVEPDRKPYCATHLLPVRLASPYGKARYPRLDYMGSYIRDKKSDSTAIDNCFTAYGKDAVLKGGGHGTIVNTIVGTPYDAINPPPNVVTAELTAGQKYRTALIDNIGAGLDPPVDQTELKKFQNWFNFGLIHSVSDHLALLVDV